MSVPFARQVQASTSPSGWAKVCPVCGEHIAVVERKDAESFTGEEYVIHYRERHGDDALRRAEHLAEVNKVVADRLMPVRIAAWRYINAQAEFLTAMVADPYHDAHDPEPARQLTSNLADVVGEARAALIESLNDTADLVPLARVDRAPVA